MNPLNYQPYQFFQPQMQQPQQIQQIQNSGFVSVRNIDEAKNYPIAPGNSITFKDETAPYVYTKTMGFSQLDRPVFEKFKLVKEEDVQTVKVNEDPVYASKSDLNEVSQAVESIKEEVDRIKKELEAGV